MKVIKFKQNIAYKN